MTMTKKQGKEKRVYVLYDGRACSGDTDDASVILAVESHREAKACRGEYGDMACYSYREENSELVDERFEWNYFG